VGVPNSDELTNQTIEGGCHCGNIRFRFVTARAIAELPVRRCTCSFCRKHGALYTSDPNGRLSVAIREPQEISRYRFGTRTAEPMICRHCGVLPVTLARIDGRIYAVVNLTASDADPGAAHVEEVDFSSQTAEERTERRRRNWIPTVTVTPPW
jgi:hypothetical protein